MFCINCFHKNTSVTNSRPHKKKPSIWRRRKCANCNAVFTTFERPSLSENTPIHLPDGKTDTFNLGRLTLSIAASFAHSPDDRRYSSLHLAQTVEDTLSSQRTSITPGDIEAATHQTLKQFDELAAIQYAAQHQLIASTRRRGRPSLRAHEPRSDVSPSQ